MTLISGLVSAIRTFELGPGGWELRLEREEVVRHPNVVNYRACQNKFAVTTFHDPSRHYHTKKRPYASWVFEDIHENP